MVGLVLVSHSSKVAEGTAELVEQMAGEVRVRSVGGDAEGGIGTDPERIQSAIEEIDSGDGVLVFMDLGSAILSAETVLEMLDADLRDRTRLVNAPFVEGAFAAGVAAAAGSDLEECLEAADQARTEPKIPDQ
ncbi:dihydroxyacetone kinase, phosphotransfer subunit [Rubrobacter radiotolerans]|uniref:phosphoenolpyruvate--glycerone phosphotransferase n=1 Tax=Rubrobacter radiotolerans TaxID=42256 RepID=A0A023X2S7_RUBRA|nr:dihydroxyacetone kinase phosphoryl donor subunit DhaM [Rubrobacter radiotolerans]AHY46310.1 dihydroxyacetone kinase, phosphotransfer subunit [Rubrobacter radiotolerans]MDX5893717.1 dihydroxyacetone kinase phosphoryl donor subunit DhaM [Rubrobacter radiotolerans]SMC04348.1 dihydroxyacetone kinase DhaM subunit [Rubrobacter radiotolerans DSM 5868]